MKAIELNLAKENFTMSCNTYAPKSHYKYVMSLGRVFPTTSAQAKYFLASGSSFDILNSKDVEIIESLLNKHGFKGNYQYTKSKTWVRLTNVCDFEKALKKEYNI